MTKYVAVKTAGVIKVHLPHTDGNYYTLCGEDGDDPSEAVDSVAVDVPKGAKVDCVHCLRIWEVCKTFTAKDFAAPNTACTRQGAGWRKNWTGSRRHLQVAQTVSPTLGKRRKREI